MVRYSEPAANLCDWLNNVVEYNRIFKIVTPLKQAAAEADKEAGEKKAELEIVLEKVRVINEKVQELKDKLAEAEAKAAKVEADAQILINQLDLANRLVNGLADEKIRWTEKNARLGQEKLTMIGDAIVSAAFVSYIGPFSADFRIDLWKEIWLGDIAAKSIPCTKGIDPLSVLSTPTDHATWSN
jgi:dynein heavy chain